MAGQGVYTTRTTKFLEWIGLTLVIAWLKKTRPHLFIEDVHDNSAWFDKGIDLILAEGGSRVTVDLKVDSYFGKDPNKKARGLYNLDSDALLFETISQLRFDRDSLVQAPDVPGWFWTSEADEVYHYFIAVLGPVERLKELHREAQSAAKLGGGVTSFDTALLADLEVERDLLVTYPLKEAREWYRSAPSEALGPWVGATNPGYVTVSRRIDREYFLRHGPGRSYGSLLDALRSAASG